MRQVKRTWAAMVVGVAALGLVGVANGQAGIDDPVAYWNFEDADCAFSNLVTSSSFHDATVLFGQPAVGVADGAAGIVGNALILDGTSAFRLPYHHDNLGRSFTIALWYWQQTQDTRQCLFQSRDNYTISYETTDGNRDVFGCYAGQVWAGDVKTGLQTWIHIAHTFSTVGNTVTLTVYSNGVQVVTKSGVAADTMFDLYGVRGLHVGAYRSATKAAGGRCFKGMIDELALWDRALSTAEVQAVYARGADGEALAFTPKALPSITLAPGQLAYRMRVDAGQPDGMFWNGWLSNGGTASLGGVWETARAEVPVGGTMPDTAGHDEGPFDAEKLAQTRLRIPMAADSALKRLPQGDFTLEAWFRTTSTGPNVLFGTYPGTGGGAVNLQLEGWSWGAMLYWSTNTATTSERVVLPPAGLTGRDGNWHHLAGVRCDTNAYLYMDGVLIGSNTWTHGKFDLGGNYLYIGQDGRNDWGLFDGEIGTARVWARALNADEVAGVAANCAPGFGVVARDGLLAEYAPYEPFNAIADRNGWRVPLSPPLRQVTQTNYTFEVMFRTTDSGRGILLGNYSGASAAISNFELAANDQFRLVTANSSGGNVTVWSGAVSGTRDGNWHRAAAVRRDGKLYLYMDGVQRGNAATETLGSYALAGYYLGLGKDFRWGAGVPLNGDLGAARIWNRALTADEIADLPNNVPAAGLVAQYAPFPTNTLQTAGFPGSYFLRSMSAGTNSAMLRFTGLPRHTKIDLGMILAQLESLDPATEDDRFIIRLDGIEILRVGLGPDQDIQPQVHSLELFGATADVQLIKDTLTQGGQDLFCGGGDVLYKDHVYDLAQLEDLQGIPHTADTLVLELIATHNFAGENEGFGVDDIQLTVYPPPGTLFTLR